MSAPRRAARAVAALDVGVVVLLAAVALSALAPVFGGWSFAPAAAAGVALGAVLGWVAARWAWGPLATALATLLGYLVVGGAVAYPATTLAGLLPTMSTLRALVPAAVTTWKGFLTVPTPITAFDELVLVPFMAALVVTVVATSLALRLRRPGWALLPLAVLLLASILASTSLASWPVLQGGGFGVIAIAWLAWRRSAAHRGGATELDQSPQGRADARRLRRRRARGAAAMVVVVGAVVAVAGPAVAGSDSRRVLRDVIEPPLDIHQYPSPLEAFRRHVKDQEETVLLTVTGLPDGARMRLAVLDTYTGTVMDVAGGDRTGRGAAGSFEVPGDDLVGELEPPAGDHVQIQVEVVGYTGVWVPTAGVPVQVTYDGDRAADLTGGLYANAVTGTMLTTAGLRGGDSYTVDAVLPAVVPLDELTAERPAPVLDTTQARLDAADSVARTFVGTESNPVAQLRLVRDKLVSGGVFSDGLENQPPSRAGHGAERITTLLTDDQMVGDDEQFAVAAALMVRSLGYSSRVVMGLYPDPETAGDPAGPVELTGTDVHAWVEVDVQGVGWVPLDVTPDEDQPPQAEDPRSSSEPQVRVVPEPPTPEEPEEAPVPPLSEEESEQDEESGLDLGAYLRLAALVGGPLLVLVGPLVAIVLAKSRRRQRRRSATAPVDRVSGGWREVADLAVDLGSTVVPGATRRETAAVLHQQHATPRLLVVADQADAVVFGRGEPGQEEVAAFWAEVDGLIGEMQGSAGRWRRLRARLSVRSLAPRRRAVEGVRDLGTAMRARLQRRGGARR